MTSIIDISMRSEM